MKRIRFVINSTMPIIQQNLARLAGLGVTDVSVFFHDQHANQMTLRCLVSSEQNDKLKAEFHQ